MFLQKKIANEAGVVFLQLLAERGDFLFTSGNAAGVFSCLVRQLWSELVWGMGAGVGVLAFGGLLGPRGGPAVYLRTLEYLADVC